MPSKKPTKKYNYTKKPGRPTKFTKEIKLKAEKLSRRGFTDKEVAEFVDVNETTIHRWKVKHTDFCQSLKMWKESSNENVQLSLYQRACGYSHAETKAQWVPEIGKKKGQWETLDMVKHYPPDTAACFIWLKNRDPENWKDKYDHNVSGNLNIIIQQFSESDLSGN